MLRAADEYLAGRVKRGEISSLTRRNHYRALVSFARSYGPRPIEQLSKRAVEKWLEDNHQWKQGTRRHHWNVVKDYCEYLQSRGLIHHNPFYGMEAPKGPRPAPAPLSITQVDELIVALPDARARLIVALMYDVGLRCASVANLQIDDIDWVNREIRVVGKGNRHYSVPLTDNIADKISAYLNEYPASSGPLIRSYVRPWAPVKPSTIGEMVSAWMTDAGVKKGAHDRRSAHTLRATALTETARATNDPYLVQALAGHASISTATWYVPRVGTKAVSAALDKRAMERAVLRVQP